MKKGVVTQSRDPFETDWLVMQLFCHLFYEKKLYPRHLRHLVFQERAVYAVAQWSSTWLVIKGVGFTSFRPFSSCFLLLLQQRSVISLVPQKGAFLLVTKKKLKNGYQLCAAFDGRHVQVRTSRPGPLIGNLVVDLLLKKCIVCDYDHQSTYTISKLADLRLKLTLAESRHIRTRKVAVMAWDENLLGRLLCMLLPSIAKDESFEKKDAANNRS